MMKPITTVVREWTQAYFSNSEVEISEDGDRSTCQFTTGGSDLFEYRCYVEVYEDRPGIMVFHYAPFKVPQVKRSAVTEVLVRVNYALANGAIDMDMQDGEIRYKAGVDVRDGVISARMINDMVDSGTSVLNQYLPAIAAVIYAGLTPEQALHRADHPEVSAEQSPSEMPDQAMSQENIRSWDMFAGCESVRSWAEDLKKMLTGNGQTWALAGSAAVIVNEDKNYCRDILRRVAADNNMTFTAIAANDVMDMLQPSGFRELTPTLVYLEPGRWMKSKSDTDESDEATERVKQFQFSLSGWLQGFNAKFPVVYVVSTARLENIARSLRNVGGFERFIALPEESLESLAENFLANVGRAFCSTSLQNSPGKLGKLLRSEVYEQRKLAVPYLQRLYYRKSRLLEFVDLVHAFSHGLQEEGTSPIETDELRRQVAYHEAGHAVVALLDSGGKNVPEYTSIVPSVAFNGIVVESYAFHHAHDGLNTYRNFRHNIRIALAARAAEEIAFGIENVSSASADDLENASRSAFKAFLYWGFVPQMDAGKRTARNLGVVFGQPSNSEMSHAEALVREFLEQEYEVVKIMLKQNSALLDSVATRLLSEQMLDQDELSAIYSGTLGMTTIT